MSTIPMPSVGLADCHWCFWLPDLKPLTFWVVFLTLMRRPVAFLCCSYYHLLLCMCLMRTSWNWSPIQCSIQKHGKCTEGGSKILWQFDFKRSCKFRGVLRVPVSISYILFLVVRFVVRYYYFMTCSLLFFLYIFLFILDFWFLLRLGLHNLNWSRRYNFIAYIKAPCIHFFQWIINESFFHSQIEFDYWIFRS